MNYHPSAKEIHRLYHLEKNAVLKNEYRNTLAKRANNGNSEAKRYLMMIDGKLCTT